MPPSTTIALPSQVAENSDFAVSVDGRIVYFYDESTHSILSVSSSDGELLACFHIEQLQYASRSRTWIHWLTSYVLSPPTTGWRLVRIFSNRPNGLLMIFHNESTRALHALLYHANAKTKRLVLLDSSETILPEEWSEVQCSAQQVDVDFVCFISYVRRTHGSRHYHWVTFSVTDGHFDVEEHGLFAPAGVFSWLGVYQNQLCLLLWDRQAVFKRNIIEVVERSSNSPRTSLIGWERVDIKGHDNRFPLSEKVATTVPLIRSGRAWICEFGEGEAAGRVWSLDLNLSKWTKYPDFDRLGPTVLRKVRGAVQVNTFGAIGGVLRLGQFSFAQDSSRALLTCPACRQLYRDPVNLRCGHSLCSTCLPKCLLEDQVFRCIVCQRRISATNNLPINLALREVIAELQAGSSDYAFCAECSLPQHNDNLLRCFTCAPLGTSLYCAMCLLKEHHGHHIDLSKTDGDEGRPASGSGDFAAVDFPSHS